MQLIRSRISHLGLWPRIALAVSLSFLALFATFAILGERALHDSANHILNERVILAQMAAGEVDEFLHHVFTELTDAHRMSDFDPADPDMSAEARAMTHIQREIGSIASSILFLDATGRVVLTLPSDLYATGTDLSHLPYVAKALEMRDFTISEPFLDPITDLPVAAASNPINKDGRFAGLLIGLVDLSGESLMIPLERAASVGNTGHATLIDGEGRSLAATLDVPLLGASEHPDFYQEAIAQGKPHVGTTPFAFEGIYGETYNESHVMAYAPLSAAPWGVAVGGDKEDTFAGVKRLRFGLVLLSVISLVGVWIITLGGTRKLIRPIQQLTVAAQKIARGDLDTPLHVPGYGEIGVMTAALSQMQTQLIKNITDLSSWNETLEDLVAQKTEEIRQQQTLTQRLLRHNITAQEQERTRLARELHDGIGQMLMAIEFSLDSLCKILPPDDATAHEHLEGSRTLTEKTSTDLRHIIGDLRPGVLDQLGLIPALRWMGKHILQPVDILTEIEADGVPKRLSDEIETTLFRIAQEAMNNVARHSRANRLIVQLCYESGAIIMTLKDDGQGFDPTAVSPDPIRNRGFGLAGIQERASLAGGQVIVTSTRGQGTTIQASIPTRVVAPEM